MRYSISTFSLIVLTGAANAADPGIEFFEAKVRPLLVDNCYKCHSTAAQKQKGGLHLDTRDSIRQGGDTGPAVVPGKPAVSLLLKAVRQIDANLKMPPNGKLTATAIGDIEKWIAIGAPDPRDVATAGKPISIEEGRKFWSFQPLHKPALPEISNRKSQIANPIDRFIVAKLDEKGIVANPPADRRTLHPPRVFRRHRLAADAGRSDRLRQRSRSKCLRQIDRPAARISVLRRTLGPALARPRPVRREQRL